MRLYSQDPCNVGYACGQAGQPAHVSGRNRSELQLTQKNDRAVQTSPPEGADACSNASLVASLEQVLFLDPDVLRARLSRISPQGQPDRWAEENLKLGVVLQQRLRRERGTARARICAEAITAFESALGIYFKGKSSADAAESKSRPYPPLADSSEQAETNGAIDNVIDFASRKGLCGTEALEESIDLFQSACGSDTRDSDFETWVINSINLGCALVLAGKCDAANGSADRLEEAMQVCSSIAREPRLSAMPYERAAAYINLAEALTSIAELSFPDERVEYLDRALRSLAAALVAVAPGPFKSFLETDVGASA